MAADPVIVRVETLDTQGTSSSTCATACGKPAPLVGATVFGVTTPAVTETREPLEELATGCSSWPRAPGDGAEGIALLVVEQDDPDAQRRFLGVEPIATEE
jgi:hypothetical protein